MGSSSYFYSTYIDSLAKWNGYSNFSNYFVSYNQRMLPTTVVTQDSMSIGGGNETDNYKIRVKLAAITFASLNDWKTWLSNNNTTVYYVLSNPTTETITNTNLISGLNALYEFYVNSSTVTISNNSEIPLEVLLEYYGR